MLLMAEKFKPKTGIIVLGHGSIGEQALETLNQIATMVREKREEVVEIASLQFNSPSLPEAIASLVMKDIKRIIVVPLFLFCGQHVQRDIPAIVNQEATKYNGVEIILASHLGAEARIAEIVLDRIDEALSSERPKI
jgi:sirohydrochlorin ferrochelatase